MVSRYPMNAHAKTRRDIPRPRPKPSGVPRFPANDNPRIPKIPRLPAGSIFFLGKNVGKGLARLVPGLGLAITAYEIYNIFNEYQYAFTPRTGWVQTGIRAVPHGSMHQLWNNNFGFDQFCVGTTNQFYTPAANQSGPSVSDNWWQRWGCNPNIPAHIHSGLVNECWNRTGGASAVWGGPLWVPTTFPDVVPNGFPKPNVAPGSRPAPQPYPRTAPRPVPRPLPGEQPNNQPRPKARPRPSARPRPEFIRVPIMPFPIVTFPRPDGSPLVPEQPDFSIDIRPRPSSGQNPGRPKPVSRPPTGRNRPPRSRKEKERKVHVRSVAGGTWALINTFTEGLDFLGVLYDSLPEDSVCKKAAEKAGKKSGKNYVNPYQQAKAVYNCYQDIDLANTIENYVNNQVEDFVYGTIGQAVGKASGKIGVSTGLNRAIKNQQNLGGELGGADIGDLIPRIDIDDETGEFSVTVPQFGTVNFGTFGSGRVTTKRPTKEKR